MIPVRNVTVWPLDLESLRERVPRLAGLLSPDERDRASTFRHVAALAVRVAGASVELRTLERVGGRIRHRGVWLDLRRIPQRSRAASRSRNAC